MAATLIGRSVFAARAGAGALGGLTAPFAAAPRTVALLLTLRIGFVAAGALRLAVALLVARLTALARLLIAGLCLLLAIGRTFIVGIVRLALAGVALLLFGIAAALLRLLAPLRLLALLRLILLLVLLIALLRLGRLIGLAAVLGLRLLLLHILSAIVGRRLLPGLLLILLLLIGLHCAC